MANHFQYQFAQLTPTETRSELTALQPYFNNLPIDHFIESNHRRRRLSRFTGTAENLIHLPHQHFMQSRESNQLFGNIQRDYEELENALIQEPAFILMLKRMQVFFAMDARHTLIGVHQIRICCEKDSCGEPAPEGIHQDGFDHLMIFCVNRVDVSGAATNLYQKPEAPALCSQILEPGSMVYVNDRTVYHYTTPILPVEEAGYRDVFVVTAVDERKDIPDYPRKKRS